MARRRRAGSRLRAAGRRLRHGGAGGAGADRRRALVRWIESRLAHAPRWLDGFCGGASAPVLCSQIAACSPDLA
ncbi:hypothetical protein [Lysobacter gummosus]|uniref:hypothetical protein n=1 Tax=Lysobacter gummosus TaxID=262324 RepID=UPI0036298621